jgi:hypothetical protein
MAITTYKHLSHRVSHESLGNISPFLHKGLLEFQQLLPPTPPDLNITLVGWIEQACEKATRSPSQFAGTRASTFSGIENYETKVFYNVIANLEDTQSIWTGYGIQRLFILLPYLQPFCDFAVAYSLFSYRWIIDIILSNKYMLNFVCSKFEQNPSTNNVFIQKTVSGYKCLWVSFIIICIFICLLSCDHNNVAFVITRNCTCSYFNRASVIF